MIKPSQDIINQIVFYNDRALELFSYLNGRISNNLCIAQIGGFSDRNFAEFMFPHRIAIFTGSIVESYYEPEADAVENYNYIMSVMTLVIAHELFHASQVPDVYVSSKNKEYLENIEDSAELSAEMWCYNHINEFRAYFGFEYVFGFNRSLKDKNPQLVPCESDRNYAIRSILGLFRNSRVSECFAINLDKYDILYLYINDIIYDIKWVFTVKYNGVVSFNRYDFSLGLSQFRRGISPNEFGVDIYTKKHKDNNYGIFCIDIKERKYSPIYTE